jgi:hypothetical protein
VLERTTDAVVLYRGIDRNGPRAADWIALVQKVAADDSSIDFGNQVEETFVTYETGQKARHQSIRLL